jgi:tetratricopeptide (TPR) repeat protein
MATSAELLNQAVRLHQNGDLARAEPLYRQVLQAEPSNVNALHLFGILANQAGRHDVGIPLLRQAIALNSSVPEMHGNLASALFDHGNILFGKELFAQAADCYRQALAINPDQVETHNNLGNAYHRQGQLEEAAACFRQALALNPQYADAHFNLGNVCFDQGKFDDAVACYRAALRLNPQHAEAHNNLGNALKELGQLADATKFYRQATFLKRRQPQFFANLGNVLKDQGQLTAAAECYRQALRIAPNRADVHASLGVALAWQGNLQDAAACFENALRIDSVHWFARWNRSLLQLLQGDFAGGWQDYELRFSSPEMSPRSFQQPRWDGSPLDGKTILVHAEQGLGDSIQFARYLPLVARRGGKVIFDCPSALHELFRGLKGVNHLVGSGEPVSPFDVQVPLLSLPGVFQTTLDTIPAAIPYLEVDPELVLKWEQLLARDNIGRAARRQPAVDPPLSIGIAWQGNPKVAGDCLRSIPLERFAPLARLPGVRLVSLQKGHGTDQWKGLGVRLQILDLEDQLKTFSDTAAVMKNLDLVITSDTSVAHLAGALGVPVWTALQLVPDWRWLLDRSDSPWHPTMRLFRQKKIGDWDEVFERMAREISSFTPGSANRG